MQYHFAPAEVYATLTDQSFWEDSVGKISQIAPTELASFSTSDAGVDVLLNHTIPSSMLPGIAQGFAPNGLKVTHRKHWAPFGEPTTMGTYDAVVVAQPGSLKGTMTLSGDDNSSQVSIESEVTVNIPLFGRKIEEIITSYLGNLFTVERDITAEWLVKHT